MNHLLGNRMLSAWQLNRNICLDAVTKYKTIYIWGRREHIDIHVLDEWEQTVRNHEEDKINILSKKYIYISADVKSRLKKYHIYI